jgi:hypothetical protein
MALQLCLKKDYDALNKEWQNISDCAVHDQAVGALGVDRSRKIVADNCNGSFPNRSTTRMLPAFRMSMIHEVSSPTRFSLWGWHESQSPRQDVAA